MEKQLIFGDDLSRAERNKEAGMQAAIGNAEAKIPTWREKAHCMLVCFLEDCDEEFLTEDVRRYAKRHGLPDPPNDRAWGTIIRQAARDEIILFTGYARTTNPKAHRTPATLWIRKKR